MEGDLSPRAVLSHRLGQVLGLTLDSPSFASPENSGRGHGPGPDRREYDLERVEDRACRRYTTLIWQTRLIAKDGIDMVFHMKTTLNIADEVMRRLREEAARRGTTMSALVEAGLRRVLAEPEPSSRRETALPPLPTWNSGGFRVDIANREELYRILDEE